MYVTQLVLSMIHRDEGEVEEFVKYTNSRYHQYQMRGANFIECFTETIGLQVFDDKEVLLENGEVAPWPPLKLLSATVESSVAYLPFDPTFFSVDVVEDLLKSVDAVPGVLRLMLTLERDGKNRTGALKAIQSAIQKAEEK